MNIVCNWLTAHATSCLELVAVLFGIAGVWLSIYEKTANWPIGIINVALYAVLFVQQKLYANAGLQVVYVGVSVYGWYHWVTAPPSALIVKRVPRATVVPLGAAVLAIWLALTVITRFMGG